MKQEVVRKSHNFFTYLPSEITTEILLRLPNETISRCKCVCKSWRQLIETREFVKSHLSISVPGLAVYFRSTNQYKLVQFPDEHCLNSVFSFKLPFISSDFIGHKSVNGLLFVCNRNDYAFICNPITREYIRLPSPLTITSPKPTIFDKAIYGFGVSKVSGQYKVVRINLDVFCAFRDCQVYTVGTGLWRRIELDEQLGYKGTTVGAFLNGNLHWLAFKKDYDYDLICCLDLETERFSTFSPPCDSVFDYRVLSILGDHLCVCDTSIVESGTDLCICIQLMKEYGDEKSWISKLISVIIPFPGYMDEDYCPMKVFEDGDMLMDWGSCRLLYYSSKSKTIEEIPFGGVSFAYTPSFLPLKTFAMEKVRSF